MLYIFCTQDLLDIYYIGKKILDTYNNFSMKPNAW